MPEHPEKLAAGRFEVPYTRESDDVTFIIPVTAATADDALEIVRLSIETGQLDPSKFQAPDTEAQKAEALRVRTEGRDEHGHTFEEASVGQGVKKTGFNIAKFGLLLADSITNEEDSPAEQAQINKWKEELRAFRASSEAVWAEKMEAAFGTPDASFAHELIGEALPLLPFAWQAKGGTFLGMIGKNSLLGGTASSIAGAGQASELGDLAWSATWGALLAAGFSMFGGIRGVKASAGRAYANQLDNKLSENLLVLETKIQKLTGNPDFHFTMGQLGADNPWLVGLERGALGQRALKIQNERVQTLVDFLETTANKLSPDEIALKLHTTLNKISTDMNKIARSNYSLRMDSIIDRYGDDLVLEGRQYLDDLIEMANMLGDPRRFGGSMPGNFAAHFKFVEDRVLPFRMSAKPTKDGTWIVTDRRSGRQVTYNTAKRARDAVTKNNKGIGGLTADDTVQILRGHNSLISGERSIFDGAEAGSSDHIGRFLKTSMLRNLQGRSGGAVKEITTVNNALHFDLQKVRVIKESTLGRLFGDGYESMEPEALLLRLTNSGRVAMTHTRKILLQNAPDTLHELQGAAIRNILETARDTSVSPAFIETDLIRLANLLKGPGKREGTGRFGLGLFSPLEQQELIRVAQAARTLRTNYLRDITKDTAGMAADVGINIVSLTAAFMARLMVRILGKGDVLERIMVDPNARKAMLELAKRGPNHPGFKSAAIFLGTWIGEDAAEQAADQRIANQAEAVRLQSTK